MNYGGNLGRPCFLSILRPFEREYFKRHGHLWIRMNSRYVVWLCIRRCFPAIFLADDCAANWLTSGYPSDKYVSFSACIQQKNFRRLPSHDKLIQLYLYGTSFAASRFFREMANPGDFDIANEGLVDSLLKQETTWRKKHSRIRSSLMTRELWTDLSRFSQKAKKEN